MRHFVEGFERAAGARGRARRVGAELKFPLVDLEGRAASAEATRGLWDFLVRHGWSPDIDPPSGEIIGATLPGPRNDTRASCETGHCKVEFSLAHVADLHELAGMVGGLRGLLGRFCGESGHLLLGFGIQPVSRPGKHLEMKKSRNMFWDRIFGSNRHVPPEDGDDVHLFTLSAASQVHIDVTIDEAIQAVNVFNGFSGAQIALTANSNIWRGELDTEHRCVGEVFWDWWIPGTDRYGVPPRPFVNVTDYVHTVSMLPPVYVRRDGRPIGLPGYNSFHEYYSSGAGARGIGADGGDVELTPEPADIDQHATFYWYNARISRYYTLENRVNDQQPPDDLVVISALTLGLCSALDEAEEEIRACSWDELWAARTVACRHALGGAFGEIRLHDLAGRMLEIAKLGLRRRGLGETEYLEPLCARLADRRCPADEAAALFREGGMAALLRARRI
ncbi:MAG: hypothetical protein ABI333_00895 [bacterium]